MFLLWVFIHFGIAGGNIHFGQPKSGIVV